MRERERERAFCLQTFITTGVKKGDLFFGDIVTKLKKRNVTTDIKLDTNSRV